MLTRSLMMLTCTSCHNLPSLMMLTRSLMMLTRTSCHNLPSLRTAVHLLLPSPHQCFQHATPVQEICCKARRCSLPLTHRGVALAEAGGLGEGAVGFQCATLPVLARQGSATFEGSVTPCPAMNETEFYFSCPILPNAKACDTAACATPVHIDEVR